MPAAHAGLLLCSATIRLTTCPAMGWSGSDKTNNPFLGRKTKQKNPLAQLLPILLNQAYSSPSPKSDGEIWVVRISKTSAQPWAFRHKKETHRCLCTIPRNSTKAAAVPLDRVRKQTVLLLPSRFVNPSSLEWNKQVSYMLCVSWSGWWMVWPFKAHMPADVSSHHIYHCLVGLVQRNFFSRNQSTSSNALESSDSNRDLLERGWHTPEIKPRLSS